MTHKQLINAVLAVTISFCGSAIAQQAEFTGNSSHQVAPAYSPQQLRESLNAFARSNEQAKQNAHARAGVPAPLASDTDSNELVFRPLPKVIPASSPIAAVSSESIESPESKTTLPTANAFPELPSVSIFSDEGASDLDASAPEPSVPAGQSVSINASNPLNQESLNQESIEIPEAALSVPAGLRVPEGLLDLPVSENLSSVSATPSQSLASESLALPPGINIPLAESMTGESFGPVEQTPVVLQSATVSSPAPAPLPAIQDAIEVGGALEPRSFELPSLPSVEQPSFASETFSAAASQPLSSPQVFVESPGAYGFQRSVPVAPIFDPANPPQNPVPQNTFPVQQNQFEFAQSHPNAWQAPFTPTPGHNERNHITRDLSLAPPPITGRPLTEYLPVQPPAFGPTDFPPKFDRQVGHRSEQPIRRFDSYPLNDGEKFAYETKKRDFPPFGEIIATGRFFYMAEALWAEPQFQANTLIATQSAGFGESLAGDFDSDFHPRFRFGFESPYGPGIEFTYFNINSNSELASFTSDGITSGQTSASVVGLDSPSSIFANDIGEQLVTQHSLDIDSFTVSFFKELKFPISRVNGNFGFQYVSIAQELNANVSAGGAVTETLRSVTDLRAFGPRAIIEYYRPIGHTPLELVTTFGGAVLFGQRDQFVTNSETGALTRFGADEFLTILDFFVGAQYTRNVGENRAWYGRVGFMNQTWIGGGSASFPEGDLGIRGLTFGIGYNR